MNRALKLPNVCHVSTPPVSLCSVINGAPTAVPTPSTEGSTASPVSESAGAVAFGPSRPLGTYTGLYDEFVELVGLFVVRDGGKQPDEARQTLLSGVGGACGEQPSGSMTLCYLLDKNKTASYGSTLIWTELLSCLTFAMSQLLPLASAPF
ncbi:uncharacterized protein LOC120139930 [Hibiscus syriacus]|uniref:uncharacterized protein LOC120139930 n=1 Tax=Hibiscus syriacus TaxID=106335 RepID=UPI00192329D7|nr:uncharacterized protein LOC120139930 [Hibiscus syriacus]